MMSKTHPHKSLGGILLLAVLMVATVALSVIGTLEEKSSPPSTHTTTETETQTINATQVSGGGLEATNTTTTTIRT